jgi:hypothetical protein
MSTIGGTGADAEWFDKHLERELQNLFSGKTNLSGFKLFLMPNAWWLDLPLGHKAHEIKGILAEQHTYDYPSMSDEKMVEILKKELSKPS